MLIVHHLPAALHEKLCTQFSQDARFEKLPEDAPWDVPEEADALLIGNGVMRQLDREAGEPGWARRLKWVHFRSAGIDDAPDWLLRPETVTVSRGAAASAIAEYVLGSMLAHSLDVPALWVHGRADWQARNVGGLLGHTLGIIGFGEIGRAVAARALPFGMTVVASRRGPGPSHMQGVEIRPFDDVLAAADQLVLCAPLTPETEGMIGAAAFARMREGTHLINVSRGRLVDEAALRAALDGGRLARMTTDVWNAEPPPENAWVYSHPRVSLSPHISFRGPETEARTDAILFRNVRAWLSSRPQEMHGLISRDGRY